MGSSLSTEEAKKRPRDDKGAADLVVVSSQSGGSSSEEEKQYVQVSFPARDKSSSLNTTMWFMVDLSYRPKITQGATPLVARCMREYGWSEAYARRVLKAYQQFLKLKQEQEDWNDDKILCPSTAVNQMWHSHIVDLTNYVHDCLLLCGQVVICDPDGGLDNGLARAERIDKTVEALTKRFHDNDIDFKLWSFGSGDSSHEGAEDVVSLVEVDDAAVEGGGSNDCETIKIGFEDIISDAQYYFIVNPDEHFAKAFHAVAKRLRIDQSMLSFVIKGENVLMDQTPNMMGMEDGDIIQIVHEQGDF